MIGKYTGSGAKVAVVVVADAAVPCRETMADSKATLETAGSGGRDKKND